MKIIKPSIEVIEFDREKILKNIELAGRVCYKTEDKITDESKISFFKKILKLNHMAVTEFSHIVFRVICDRGCCYSEDTKVLTENGFKFFKDVEEKEKIYTLDDNNNLVLIDYVRLIKKDYSGKLYNFNSTQIDLSVTDNHNMWVYDYHKRSAETRNWKFIKASDMSNKRYKFFKSSKNFKGYHIDNIVIEGCEINKGFWTKQYPELKFNSKLFLKLLGLWVTDGSISFGKNGSGNRIVISQIKKNVREYIENILIELGINYTKNDKEFRLNSPQLFKYLVKNFIIDNNTKKTYYLKLPKWIKDLNIELLQEFIKGCLLGDGSESKDGRKCIYTASLSFAEDLVEIYLKLGLSANINISKRYKERTDGKEIKSKATQYIVNVINTPEHLYNKNEKNYNEKDYQGKVYCLELPKYHKLYVMRNGKSCWCGNSHEIVRHRLFSFCQESTRYCNYNNDKFGNELTFIQPCFWGAYDEDNSNYIKWWCQMQSIEASYLDMINNGATPQEARSVLPNSLKTEILIGGNLREWLHFLDLRTSIKAHPQMKEVADMILEVFKEKLPELYE